LRRAQGLDSHYISLSPPRAAAPFAALPRSAFSFARERAANRKSAKI